MFGYLVVYTRLHIGFFAVAIDTISFSVKPVKPYSSRLIAAMGIVLQDID